MWSILLSKDDDDDDAIKLLLIFIPTNFTLFSSLSIFFRRCFCYFQTRVQPERRDRTTLSSPDLWTKCWERCKISGVTPRLRRCSALHPSVAWSSASGLYHLWYAHPCTSVHRFDQSFSDFCQALILWNTNAVFGKMKIMCLILWSKGYIRFHGCISNMFTFFCASSPFG